VQLGPAARLLLTAAPLLAAAGCCSRITARNLDPCVNEREGIPFYLPKPYLVVAKNVRFLPPPTVGLTQPAPVPVVFDTEAREVTMTGSITEARTLALERKLLEESRFSRAETDAMARTIEDRLSRLIEDKLSRLEEDKKSEAVTNTTTVTTTRTETTPDDATVTRTDSTTTTDTTSSTDVPQDGFSGGGTQLQGAEVGQAPAAAAALGQVLGMSDPPVVPAGAIPDGLIPHTFYTFQVVYLPDLTQKYGLEIHNGPGEFRATMNLVNGWMHTGAGPIYMRDSTTAANTVATGMAVGNVIDALAGLGFAGAGPIAPTSSAAALANIVPGLAEVRPGTQLQGSGGTPEMHRTGYAELYIYEPTLVEMWINGCKTKRVEWALVGGGPIQMDRDWLAISGDVPPQTAENVPDSERRLEQLRQQIDGELPGLLKAQNFMLADGRPAEKTVRVEREPGTQIMKIRLNGKLSENTQEQLKQVLRERFGPDLGFAFLD